MTLAGMGEARLLELILPYLARSKDHLLVAPGEDDSAAWDDPEGGITVATVDTFIEGVHFRLDWLTPAEVGWRSLALALGDLAAKGARPAYALVSASVPSGWRAADLAEVYRGMAELAAETGLLLVGGDTNAAPHDASFTLALLGKALGPVVPRSAARPGWQVAVTGRLGSAVAALEAVRGGLPCPPPWEDALRHPQPRLVEGLVLARHGLCCGDVSDGLFREMQKFALASGAGCRLELASVPTAEGVAPEAAIASGEEVELVCVGPAAAVAAAAAELQCPLTRVGELVTGTEVVVVDSQGRELTLPSAGYEHFR